MSPENELSLPLQRWRDHTLPSYPDHAHLIEQGCHFAQKYHAKHTVLHASTIELGIAIADYLMMLHADSTAVVAGLLYPIIEHDATLLHRLKEQGDKNVFKLVSGFKN